MGFLGFGKKKETTSQPTIPELPADLKEPTADLAEPPKPGETQQNTEVQAPPALEEKKVPELPSEAPTLEEETSEIDSQTQTDDYNLDDFDFEAQDFDSQEEGVLPDINEDLGKEVKESNEEESTDKDFAEVAKQVRSDHFKRKGPFYLRVENFKDIISKTAEAKNAVDACLENGNDIITTNNSQIKSTTDKLQITLQQAKKKLYLAGDILFK